ncbi:MarR family transcriptional regulator [Inconstantimicrobium mannanitabidum]|uniref:MarR family transcriptional regulator n=1 Tax=Inconstantimicrobium mannanitabidum TaxID=1604901 RepID=A0ACB5RBA1_9CLOT|nr:MarR family transcriptional regulator [Clostridium sp. TW13]GKX66473.1 MarR family transcriptional regulator [Clostridium sp. TW13]
MDKTEYINMQAYIYGGLFALSNKLQLVGDKFDTNISTKQWFLIAIIESFQHEAPTISMAAERLGSSRQNVKKMATILEDKGFLKVEKDKVDARIQRLRLTQYCTEYFAQRQEREEKYMQDLFEDFEEETLLGLLKGMKQLEKNVVKMEKKHEKEE